MNHYPHHIGDFNSATRHLTRIERSLYRDLIDLYYDTEQPLNADFDKLARRIVCDESDKGSLREILSEFFVLQDDGYHNTRCDAEISAYQGKVEQSSRAGKASAAKRLNANSTTVERPLNDRCNSVAIPLHQPEPEPEPEEPSGSVAKADQLPTVKAQSVIDVFHEVLPELPKVKLLTEKRKKAISSFCRWVLTSKKSDNTRRAQTADEATEWIRSYFERARDNDFLMGRGPKSAGHENWECDIDFLLSDKGMKQVIEKTREAA